MKYQPCPYHDRVLIEELKVLEMATTTLETS